MTRSICENRKDVFPSNQRPKMRKTFYLILLSTILPQAMAFAPSNVGLPRHSGFELKSSESDAPIDPFTAFGPDSTGIAIQELALGEGEGAVDGDVVTVSYKGRLFSNQQQFGEVEGLPVKLGKGNLVKGFEEALLGRSKNSRFIVRIPPELAWGNRGRDNNVGRQVIPPNSAVEFEVEVTNITNGIMGEVEMFGKDRVITLAFLLLLSAGAPAIENVVNSLL